MALRDARIAARLPAQDLGRARTWYSQKLGLDPVEERDGGLRYLVNDGEFSLYLSRGSADGSFSQMAFTVDDVVAEMAGLRSRGVVFEDYDMPGLTTTGGIAEIQGFLCDLQVLSSSTPSP